MKVTAVLQRYARWMPGGVSFLLALLFALTPFWYLVLLAGVAGGWFTRKMRWGALSAALGVSLAWPALYSGTGQMDPSRAGWRDSYRWHRKGACDCRDCCHPRRHSRCPGGIYRKRHSIARQLRNIRQGEMSIRRPRKNQG